MLFRSHQLTSQGFDRGSLQPLMTAMGSLGTGPKASATHVKKSACSTMRILVQLAYCTVYLTGNAGQVRTPGLQLCAGEACSVDPTVHAASPLSAFDGSYEAWFEGRAQRCCLLAAIRQAHVPDHRSYGGIRAFTHSRTRPGGPTQRKAQREDAGPSASNCEW